MADTDTNLKPLAVVTGASSGIGYELAKQFAENGFDLVVCADQPSITEAAQAFQGLGENTRAEAIQADLSTPEGVNQLYQALKGRPVDALAANAGVGLGKSFFDQDWNDILRVINTNVTGTLQLIQLVGRDMRERGRGRILITGSIAGLMPGSFQAVYNGTKALLDSFSFAIRNELKDTGVTVTCLMPGPTDTEFFERADLMDTKVGQSDKKEDPAKTAKTGFEALMKGEGDVVSGMKNKLQAAVAAVTPQSALAEMHRGMAEPGSGQQSS
jgi:short-subunit dehydrogenase